jgi:hypothetical protein
MRSEKEMKIEKVDRFASNGIDRDTISPGEVRGSVHAMKETKSNEMTGSPGGSDSNGEICACR